MSKKDVEELKEKLKTIEENPFGVHFDPVETLKECLYHSSEEIQARAARMIGSFPNEDFIEPLFRIVAETSDLEVRKTALETLGTFLHHGRMADYHRAEEAEWDLEEEDQMSGLNSTQFEAIRDFMRELVKQATWPSELRATALAFYAQLAPEEAAAQVERFYRSGDRTLKEGALQALGYLEGGDWEQLILQELSRTESDERKKAAIEAAGRHRIADAGPRLHDLLEESRDQEVREKAAEALSLIPWAKAGEHLQKFTEDQNPRVREHAQNGLIRQQANLDLEDLPDTSGPNPGAQPGPDPRRGRPGGSDRNPGSPGTNRP